MDDLHEIAPNYLAETYTVTTKYPQDDHNLNHRMEVKARLQVQGGKFRTCYSYKDSWCEIPLEELCNVETTSINEEYRIFIQLKNEPTRLWYRFETETQMESFASCLAGYYRLTISWTTNLCKELAPPSLAVLKRYKCHGPIGGFFAFKKLERLGNRPGQYILRQCEHNFNTFYIDIVRKVKKMRYANPELKCEEGDPETYKIVEKDNCFVLFKEESEEESFDDLVKLALSIPIECGKYERVAPSEFDKHPQLLLCVPPEQIPIAEVVNDLSELSSLQPRIIKFDNLIIYKGS